jgi:hypothetical protein
MPDSIASAVKLLWLSLILSAGILVWFIVETESRGLHVTGVAPWIIVSGLWVFAIILIPSRNNLARLGLLVMTAYNVLLVVSTIRHDPSVLASVRGLLEAAEVVVAALGCFQLVKKPGNDWFGPLTKI